MQLRGPEVHCILYRGKIVIRAGKQASVQKKGQVAGLVLFFSADVDIVSGQGVTSNFKVSCPCSAHFCNGKFW